MTSTLTTRRLRAVFLRPLHSRSHRLQQTKNATGRAQTRVFAGLGAFFGKEPDREQREKTEPNGLEMGAVRRMPLKRPAPGTAPTLALRAEKNPTDKGWVFRYWWWGGTLRQTYVTQRLRAAANSSGKVRNPAPTADNPTSSNLAGSPTERIRKDVSSIPILGIEPASARRLRWPDREQPERVTPAVLAVQLLAGELSSRSAGLLPS